MRAGQSQSWLHWSPASLFLTSFSLVTLAALGTSGLPYQAFYGQPVWPGEAPPCSPPRIEFHFPSAPSIPLPHPPSTHLHHQTGLSLTSKQGTLIKETVTPFMSLVELGFRDLVTSGSHNANKSLPAPRGVGLLGRHCKQGHRVGMGAQHRERETSPVRNLSDSVGEVVT